MSKNSNQFQIKNELGLHARAAAAFVKIANRYRAEIMVSREKVKVNGKSIMGVLMLAAAKGSTISIETEGDDSEEALEALGRLIEDKFGEE